MNSMHIKDVLLAPGYGAFYYDDQTAIRNGMEHDGFVYKGEPATPGFSMVRTPSTSLSIGLVLSDDTIVWGDMMSVQYSGAAGRDPLFNTQKIAAMTRDIVEPRLLNTEPSKFLDACHQVFEPHEGKRLPLAIEYGVSQALLRAAAHSHRITMAEVICSQFKLPIPSQRIPLYAQSGEDRQVNVDKMILKSVDVLPHGLINSAQVFGEKGETFREYVRWVVNRVKGLGQENYHPTLHFDVYGRIGAEFGLNPNRIVDYICRVADDADGFTVNIEYPADFGSTEEQIDGFAKLVKLMEDRGTSARIVADEYCNTLDDIKRFASAKAGHIIQIKMPDVGSMADTAKAVLFCKDQGTLAYVGGSCSETDLSARASVHISVATQADMMLAKPGMGVDEAVTITGNEQNRLLAVLASRKKK